MTIRRFVLCISIDGVISGAAPINMADSQSPIALRLITDTTDDVDLNKKLKEWERFYNYGRPHGAFDGKTPYEALRSML